MYVGWHSAKVLVAFSAPLAEQLPSEVGIGGNGLVWLRQSCPVCLRSTRRALFPALVSAWACSRPGSPSAWARLGMLCPNWTQLEPDLPFPSSKLINFVCPRRAAET